MELDSWSKQQHLYCLLRLARLWTSLLWLPLKQKGQSNQNTCFSSQVMNQCTLYFVIKSWISAHVLIPSHESAYVIHITMFSLRKPVTYIHITYMQYTLEQSKELSDNGILYVVSVPDPNQPQRGSLSVSRAGKEGSGRYSAHS